jgi:hypothetical protein
VARHRQRGLRDAPALPSGDAPARPQSATVFLLRPADFAHPAIRAQVEARAEAAGGPWAVVPSTGWAGAKHFQTAKAARGALRAAGFKGPVGKGTSSRWSR